MAHIISLETAMFDVRKEPENPINPIGGHSLLVWLRKALASEAQLTEPDAEDWGWYATVRFGGHEYLVGASAVGEPEGTAPSEWVIQIHRQRGWVERLLGRNRMSADDPLSALILARVQNEAEFAKVARRIE